MIHGLEGGIMLKAGQVLYDNDPRYLGRKVEVVRVEGAYAVCMCGPRQAKVRLDYIFSDGKPRRSGYSTVAEDGSLISSQVTSRDRGDHSPNWRQLRSRSVRLLGQSGSGHDAPEMARARSRRTQGVMKCRTGSQTESNLGPPQDGWIVQERDPAASTVAGRSCGSTAIAATMSQRSLKTTDNALLPSGFAHVSA